MDKQVSSVSKSCFLQIRKIGRKRYYITDDDPLVNSLVISRLDYGNALLYGVNSSILSKLQRIQNTAARLISRKRKHEHITPVLRVLSKKTPKCFTTDASFTMYPSKLILQLTKSFVRCFVVKNINRSKSLNIGNIISTEKIISFGVPQGLC
jgi:hypothetical protein